MQKRLYAALAFMVIFAMALSACGAQPTEPPAATAVPPTAVPPTAVPPTAVPPTAAPLPGAGFLICQVTDTGGIDDKSFNATAWKGVTDAMAQLGVDGRYLESQQQTDYERNINEFLQADCDLIITVGFLLADATAAAATANPDVNFSIVDVNWLDFPNLLQQDFRTDGAAFLAGYLAAGVSQTGIVGTFGGMQIPTVTIFMDGFYMGVEYYNQQHGTSVRVLGWDPATGTGLFTGNFESTDDGRRMGESLMDEGADIIMPVAGPVGLGTAAAILERGNAYIIGVDSDWYLTAPDYASIELTSVMKNMDVTTFNAIQAVVDGTFAGGLVVGTLANGGVGLAPYHDLASLVSAELQAEIDAISQGIVDGTISVAVPAAP